MPDEMMKFAGRGTDGTAKAVSTNNDGVLGTYIPSLLLKPGDTAIDIAAYGYTDYPVQGDFESVAISLSANKESEISIGILASKNATTNFGNLPYSTKKLTSLGGIYGAYWDLAIIDRVNTNKIYIKNESPFPISVKFSITGKYSLPNGNNETFLNGSKTDIIEDTKNTKILAGTENRYEPRDLTVQAIEFPHFNKGVFEQTIMIKNDLDADVRVNIIPILGTDALGTALYGPVVYSGTIKKTAGRIILSSEVSENVANTESRFMVGLIELRLPYSKFRVEIIPLTLPTSGDLSYKTLRRY